MKTNAYSMLATAIVLSSPAALTLASPASATIVDATFTGTITDGTDGLGLFGTAGADLTGLPFTLAIEYTTSLAGTYLPSPTVNPLFGGSNFSLPDPIISSMLTINGMSSPNVTGSFDTFNEGANGNACCVNAVSFSVSDSVNNYSIGFFNVFDSLSGDIPATLDVPLSFTPGPNDAGFGLFTFVTAGVGQTTGDFDPTTLTYTIPANGVPEPSTWVMLLTGLAGFGFASRIRDGLGTANLSWRGQTERSLATTQT